MKGTLPPIVFKDIDFKWFMKIDPEDRWKCFKNMMLLSVSKIINNIVSYLLVGLIFVAIISVQYSFEGNMFQAVLNLNQLETSLVLMVFLLFGAFFGEMIITYFINAVGYKKWNYGKDSNGESWPLIEPEELKIFGKEISYERTQWVVDDGDRSFKTFVDNINESRFEGLDISKYKKAKEREQSINSLLKN